MTEADVLVLGGHDPAHANESWRMDEVFARARSLSHQETSP